MVSLDLDLVVAPDEVGSAGRLLHSLSVAGTESKLRVRIRTDPRYAGFVSRAQQTQALGLALPVASLEDILQGKIWAAQEPTRRPTKRRKDILDIERILEAYPDLRAQVPSDIIQRLPEP